MTVKADGAEVCSGSPRSETAISPPQEASSFNYLHDRGADSEGDAQGDPYTS